MSGRSVAAGLVLLVLLAVTPQPFGTVLRAIAFVGLLGLLARAWSRRRYSPPKLTLYSVALSRQVEDAPERMAAWLDQMHDAARRHPLVLAMAAEQVEAAVTEAPSYTFVVGIPATYAQQGKDILSSHFSGAGCVVRKIEPQEFALYRPVFAAWEAEREQQEQRELEQRERRERREHTASTSSCRSDRRAYRFGAWQRPFSQCRLRLRSLAGNLTRAGSLSSSSHGETR